MVICVFDFSGITTMSNINCCFVPQPPVLNFLWRWCFFVKMMQESCPNSEFLHFNVLLFLLILFFIFFYFICSASDIDNNHEVLMAGKHYPSIHEFASAIPNHLLLGSLLEHLCFVYESNPTRSRMLFKGM